MIKPEDIPHWRERLIVTDTSIKFSRVFSTPYFRTRRLQAEHRFILRAVWFGHLTGGPMTAHKLALFLEIPRTTVIRRLAELVKFGCVERIGTRYYVSDRDIKRHPPIVLKAAKIITDAADALRNKSLPVSRLISLPDTLSNMDKKNVDKRKKPAI
jgi:hypothetical protein